mmetsp:Transcript_18225/g.45306  ORF Transcript_18225/g.45306 Transcript_18225/m.45306 type:complete len:100 (+) Transcript_18225:1194-1493(+)
MARACPESSDSVAGQALTFRSGHWLMVGAETAAAVVAVAVVAVVAAVAVEEVVAVAVALAVAAEAATVVEATGCFWMATASMLWNSGATAANPAEMRKA